jgi:hypothetical protein
VRSSCLHVFRSVVLSSLGYVETLGKGLGVIENNLNCADQCPTSIVASYMRIRSVLKAMLFDQSPQADAVVTMGPRAILPNQLLRADRLRQGTLSLNGYNGPHFVAGEEGKTDFSGVIGVLGPVFQIETDYHRVPGELLTCGWKIWELPHAESVAQHVDMVEIGEVISQRDVSLCWSCSNLAGGEEMGGNFDSIVKFSLRSRMFIGVCTLIVMCWNVLDRIGTSV